jgi:hypothetical protein
MSDYAGMTEFRDYVFPATTIKLAAGSARPVILLATTLITDAIIFNNGLFQNILILYKLFELLGYDVYLLVDRQGEGIKGYKTILPEVILKNPIPVKFYIEIGMSVAVPMRKYLQEVGARIVKLYLGNTLNIDVESVHSTPGIDFPHHVTGTVDDVWVSPHYGQNLEYTAALHGLSAGRIAPYVWDRCFTEGRCTRWRGRGDWRSTDIVIAEPNISYQKLFLWPLILCQAFADKYPAWKGRVVVMNTERMKGNVHVMTTVLPGLKLWRDGRIELGGRKSIVELTAAYSSAVFIGHQFNNDFNYMTFELLMAGFPLLHNSVAWSAFGYAWKETELGAATELLHSIMHNHEDVVHSYIGQAEQLAWAHSPYNPAVQDAWKGLLEAT